jgi:digeranylgeranylglycerophospholipid reductase
MITLSSSYDVVVVGCGPAGAMAGKYAARNGARTLVIDKKREVGLPVYDSASVIYDLAELEAAAGFKFNRARVAEYKLAGNAFISPSGKYGGMQEWDDGYGVRRPELEKELAVSAGRDGAEIWMDTKFLDLVRENGKVAGVVVQRGGQEAVTVRCKIVIAADGVYSRVSKRTSLKVPGDTFVSLGKDLVGVKRLTPVEKPFYELYMVPQLAGFFCWVAPRGDDRFGVGVAYQLDLVKTGETTREIHSKFMGHLKAIGRFDFSRAAEVSMMSGSSTTVKHAAEKLVEDGVMLVGDAAWRPLFGSNWGSPGVPTAVMTGRMAGETAAEAIKTGDVSEKSLNGYQAKLDATFKDHSKAEIVEAREYYFKLLHADPQKQDDAIAAIGDQYSRLHLYLRGAMPLADCVPKIKEWWARNPATATVNV